MKDISLHHVMGDVTSPHYLHITSSARHPDGTPDWVPNRNKEPNVDPKKRTWMEAVDSKGPWGLWAQAKCENLYIWVFAHTWNTCLLPLRVASWILLGAH